MRRKQDVLCVHCGKTFLAVRSDAERCPECRKEYLHNWRQLDTSRERRARQHREIREKAFAGYGGKCACCGETTFEFLAIDHVNGGGKKDKMTRNNYQIARYIINNNFPADFQVLCHNCNMAKGFFGECPHNMKRTA